MICGRWLTLIGDSPSMSSVTDPRLLLTERVVVEETRLCSPNTASYAAEYLAAFLEVAHPPRKMSPSCGAGRDGGAVTSYSEGLVCVHRVAPEGKGYCEEKSHCGRGALRDSWQCSSVPLHQAPYRQAHLATLPRLVPPSTCHRVAS